MEFEERNKRENAALTPYKNSCRTYKRILYYVLTTTVQQKSIWEK